MRVLVSTPAAGGMLYLGYVTSLMDTLVGAKKDDLCEIAVHFQGKESLIHRARNRAADAFRLGDFDKLVTIDADVSWTYSDFKKLVTSDKEIVGGLYPLKCFPVVMNFNPLDGKGQELRKSNRGYDYDSFAEFKKKYADERGLVEVYNVATGFLCVDQSAFVKIIDKNKDDKNFVYGTFQPDSGERKAFFDFYPSKVVEHDLESEDWGFCRLAREAGCQIYADTSITLTHTGNHEFYLGQVWGEIQSVK